MKVLLLSRYGVLGASSRVRFLQYMPYFQSQGLQVTVSPLLSDVYLRALYSGGSTWREVIKGFGQRLKVLFGARSYDVVIIEKELFPFMPALAERILHFLRVFIIVDYDDALFHRYDCHSNPLVRWLLGGKIDMVMRLSTVVIAGNQYLADRASHAGAKRVEIIPTVVDVKHYYPKPKVNSGELIVGWIGTPKTSKYLQALIPVFTAIQQNNGVRFVAVGANEEDFEGTPVEVWPWSAETEVASIQAFDVGIMPLTDSPWERGKCGYKLIQYMACGVPVIASPIGVNKALVCTGENGFLANSLGEWEKYLKLILSQDEEYRHNMGMAGFSISRKSYSLEIQGPRLLKIIKEVGS